MTFRVGQRVACVDVSANSRGFVPTDLVKGQVYVVSGLDYGEDCEGDIGLFLEGVNPAPHEAMSDSFKAWRFRPIVDTKTSVSFTTGADPESENWDCRKKVREKV